jgi:hypothetical protein
MQAAEYRLVDLFEKANICAIHAKRVTISKLSLNEHFFSFALILFLVIAKETCQIYQSISITVSSLLLFEVIFSFMLFEVAN